MKNLILTIFFAVSTQAIEVLEIISVYKGGDCGICL